MNRATADRLWNLGWVTFIGTLFAIFVIALYQTSTPEYQCKEATQRVERYEGCMADDSCVLNYKAWHSYRKAQARQERNCD